MKRCQILLVCGFMFLVFLSNVQAQDKYPNRPIELVVPFTPGGTTDVMSRMYSEKLARNLKTRIIVVNRGAGGGIPGALYVARAKKDGYTLMPNGTTLILGSFSKEANYHPLKDFIPLGQLGVSPQVFSVRSDSPFKTFEELVEYARKNPNKLNNADGGGMSPSWFNIQLLRARDIKITVIPFSGGGEAILALLGGHVDMTASGIFNAAPHLKSGKFRALAITSKERFPPFPDIPTTAELGYPYVNACSWTGIFAPSGIPQSVLNVLIPAVEKTFKDPEIIKKLAKLSVIPEYRNPEEFRKRIESEMNIMGKIVKEALQ